MTKRLCLNMIVKNEMENLDRCLRSVAPHISCWVIGDTGSTDSTQQFIRAFFAERGLPGELHEFPFHDFAQARNEALDCARRSSLEFDYLLFTDADMELVVEDLDFASKLQAEVCQLIQRSGVTYWNTRLLRRDADARYKGVTHEFVDLRHGRTEQIEGLWYRDHASGSNRIEKYERDARLLRRALTGETDPGMIARYTFYLANTLRDAGQKELAIPEYLKRAEHGGWPQEVYVSLLNAASLMAELDQPEDEVLAAYARATDSLPSRAEALHDAARYCRMKRRHEQGYELARKGLAVPYPKDGLFVQDWVYDYGMLDELAVNAYWCGRYTECRDACQRLLQEKLIPESSRSRVRENMDHAIARLSEAVSQSNNSVASNEPDMPSTPSDPRTLMPDGAKQNLAALARQLEALRGDPVARRVASVPLDARLSTYLVEDAVLPTINCFYEVIDANGNHDGLLAGVRSMRAAGHPVRVWTYTPDRLAFLLKEGAEIASARTIVPHEIFQRTLSRNEVRYFSDLFRYSLLYEHGGVWMDTDVVLLRPFSWTGPYFFNLQWASSNANHFICGNVLCAPRGSIHFRRLYEASLDKLASADSGGFGTIGPAMLTNYVLSEQGKELRTWVFSPMGFNSIDWTETRLFEKPLIELASFLNDARVIGVHLWNAKTQHATRAQDSLIELLSDTGTKLPGFIALAERFNTDKNSTVGNRHFYSRIYDLLLAPRRFAIKRLLEIGLCRPFGNEQTETPSVALWTGFFPFCQVIGVDITDFSRFNGPRFISHVCDQSDPKQVSRLAATLEPDSIDVIIDDGSHASYDEQMTFRALFPKLAPGGWYFIEDLDWQPGAEDRQKIALTKDLFLKLRDGGPLQLPDPEGIASLLPDIADIRFFDSHYELCRAGLRGGLVAIQKKPASPEHITDRAEVTRAPAPMAASQSNESRQPAAAGRLKIAVYTIALNEAAHVERWASSAVDADYRVVIDTGSTDGTPELLEAHGVIVHRVTFKPFRFDDARNAAIGLLPPDVDVCCSMDMDRWLAPGWREKLEDAWTEGTTALFCRTTYRASVTDDRPLKSWPTKNFHARHGYRFRRPVHEHLVYNGDEKTQTRLDLEMFEVQDHGKDTRARYFALMEWAAREDPNDAQILFWLGREYMWANRAKEAQDTFQRYLDVPNYGWREERAEAMRFLARVDPEHALEWLQRAQAEAPRRREVWLDMAEHFHMAGNWLSLFWACSSGLQIDHPTGSYLDDRVAFGPRLYELGAVAASHIGAVGQAIVWARQAAELDPQNSSLTDAVISYQRQLQSDSERASRKQPTEDEPDAEVADAWMKWRSDPLNGEVLHALARLYLGRARGDLALTIASAGLWMSPPPDTADPAIYAYLLKEAFYIAASYDRNPIQKERGRAICHALMFDPMVPEGTRALARRNYHWFAQRASELMPSIRFIPIIATPPSGYELGNVSVCRYRGKFRALVRCVNYELMENGYFNRHGDTSFRQKTLMLDFDTGLTFSQLEVHDPSDLPPPSHADSLGFEDPRPFSWKGGLWAISCIRQLNEEGRAEMILARIEENNSGTAQYVDWRLLPSGRPPRWEKNWMPISSEENLTFVYEVDPTRLIDDQGNELALSHPAARLENIRGGSQLLPYGEGWLAVVHESYVLTSRRQYLHRFVFFDKAINLKSFTPPFYLRKTSSEFVAGLTWLDIDRTLLLSFGTDDRDPCLATIDLQEVLSLLSSLEEQEGRGYRACSSGRDDWRRLYTEMQDKRLTSCSKD